MDIVVKGRNVEVPEHFRTHVAEKLSRSERYDSKIIRVEVELSHETNRRQSKTCQRVEITLVSKGPAVRAESSGETFYSALDGATERLESRLRKAADRRRDRQHARTPILAVAGGGSAVAGDEDADLAGPVAVAADDTRPAILNDDLQAVDEVADDDRPGRVVRIKDHPGENISVDQALLRMELVGHDFYLFNDEETGLASVVYRRQGFDYGLLRLRD